MLLNSAYFYLLHHACANIWHVLMAGISNFMGIQLVKTAVKNGTVFAAYFLECFVIIGKGDYKQNQTIKDLTVGK